MRRVIARPREAEALLDALVELARVRLAELHAKRGMSGAIADLLPDHDTDDWEGAMRRLGAERDQALAEVERLRAVLKEIADVTWTVGYSITADNMIRAARRALAENPRTADPVANGSSESGGA